MCVIVSTERTHIGRFDIVMHSVRGHDGNEHPYSFIRMRPGVCVLPLVTKNGASDDAEPQVITIFQYRIPIDEWEYELPAGIIGDNERPEHAAIRELREETGYVTDEGRLTPLGAFYPSVRSIRPQAPATRRRSCSQRNAHAR